MVATIKAQHEAARTILQKLGFIHAMDVDVRKTQTNKWCANATGQRAF
ncbi:acetyltransferase-like protein [Vibrio cholerae]|nr:acetyltransferase-like protein [Vibrio cholerae]